MKTRYLIALLILGLGVGSFWAQEKPAEQEPAGAETAAPAAPKAPHVFVVSEEDAARKNPVRFTEVMVGRGKKIYLTQCALCHGDAGDGKGELAQEMELSPPDFTKPEVLKKRTDGELYAIIGIGSEVMPSQAKRMTDRHRWQIVNFLRAVGGQKPQRSSGDEPEENIILIPQ